MRVSVKEIEVSTKELALFFNVSRQTVGLWHQKGLPKTKRGSFPLLACFEWWRENISQESKDTSLTEERRQKTVIERRIKELDLKEKEGSLLSKGTVMEWFNMTLGEARQNFRNIPYRLSPVLVGQDEKTIFLILRREIDGILRTLAGAEKGKIPEVAPWDVELVRKGIIQGDERGEVVLITSAPPFRKRVKVADIIEETEGSLPQNQSVNQEGGG